MNNRLHFIWDHTVGLPEPWRCWCGEDHPDDNGKVRADKYIAPDDPGWVAVDDPRARAALDDLYAEAWLGGEPNELDSVSARERAERLARAFQRLYNAALAVDDQDTGTLDEFRAARDVLTPDAVLALVEENERLTENARVDWSRDYDAIMAENERLREYWQASQAVQNGIIDFDLHHDAVDRLEAATKALYDVGAALVVEGDTE